MKRRLVTTAMRLLCALIDYLLLMLPVQLVMTGIMQIGTDKVDFLFRLLFAVYGVLMVEYNHGATLGKHFGKLMVVDRDGSRASMVYVGIRELIRAMYLIPVAGWLAALVSTLMMLRNGNTLHDMAAGTQVIYRWKYEPPEEDAP